MHCSAGTAVHMRALFPKESPMLGFSFSLVVSGGESETRQAFSWTEDGCGQRTGLWMEMGGWTGVDGAVEGRWMLSRTKHGGANSTPCLAEERYCASGTVWRGLYDGLGCPECVQCMPKTAQVIAETAGWLHARTAMLQISWLERSMEGADAAPRFLEGLLEAMLQSFYDRFGGLSKLTKGWTGVYMADGGGRMRTRTAMLEISWLPRSLEGADASFWPANVRLFIFPGLRVSFCFWVRGLTLFCFTHWAPLGFRMLEPCTICSPSLVEQIMLEHFIIIIFQES